MNPPVFAVLSVYLYSLVSGTAYVMDTHSPALYSRKWGWTLPLQRFLAKRALVNIVDQSRFQAMFRSWGAESIVLERPPLDASRLVTSTDYAPLGQPGAADRQFHVAVIGTFAGDEPVEVVVDAAHRLPDVAFSILGDSTHARQGLVESSPSNVSFTGYLSGNAYWNHLASADAIITLTTYEYSLLGGAQEGMAMGKPLILSRQPVLTDYFSKGTVFIEHSAESVIEAVETVMANHKPLSQEIAELATEKRRDWENSFETLRQLIDRQAANCKEPIDVK